MGTELTGAKRRIIERLKRADRLTASDLAGEFGLSDTALRQHLEALAATGLVERVSGTPAGRGRPAVQWRLASLAAELFPDRHAELTVELIDSIRESLGEAALARVIEARADRQLAAYREAIPESASVQVKVRRLAQLRSAEGYMAEAVVDERHDGASSAIDATLIEHHCPIAGAAGACAGLCQAELELFRRTLGPAVRVERAQHLLAGASRCAYRITAA
jgi:predicted ArsR family transcriptional regulator